MIGYVTFGTNDKNKAAGFFDTVLQPLGAVRMMENERGIFWHAGGGTFGIMEPFDGKPQSVGNGAMVALNCGDTDKVEAVYKLALDNGGSDEGPPGLRAGNFFGGYFRDPDGNKFVAFCMKAD